MRKFILVFVLSLLAFSFSAFLLNSYIKLKNYRDSSTDKTKTEETNTIGTEDAVVPSKYQLYSEEEYNKAINEKRVLVLYFTANWCNECQEQDLINVAVFESLNKEGVVGLKVNVLDSETTTETDALAKKFDVTKEESFVILDKQGAVYFKQTGAMDEESLKLKIQEVVNK